MSYETGLSEDLRALLEQSTLGAVVHEKQRVLLVNQEATRLLGRGPEHLRTVEDVGRLLFGEHAGKTALCARIESAGVAAAAQGGAPREPVRLPFEAPDGTRRWLEVLPPAFLPTGLYVQTFLDATELEAERRARSEVDRRLETALRSAEDFVLYQLRLDPDSEFQGVVELVSPSLSRIMGVPPDTPLPGWFANIHPDDLPRVAEANARAAARQERFSEIARVWRPDEERWGWIHAISNPVRDEEGVVTHYLGLIVDITAQREAEDERRRLEVELARKHRLEALGTLAGGVAHDFNNLLMAMQGTVAMGLDDTHESELAHEHFTELQQLVESAAVLTRELLGYARRGRYDVRPFDLIRLLDDVTRAAARSHPDADVQVAAAEPLVVRADRAQLERVFLNLLVNAADATDGEPIRVEARRRDVGPAEEVPAGAYVEVAVVDRGEGMDEATRRRVFEPFFTTKPMGRGTGLGLAAAHGIVRGHGGTIVAESTPGEGTTMRVLLPLSSDRPVVREPADEEAPPTRTILVVDDEKVVRTVVRRLLERAGYRVLDADGVDGGVAAFFEHHPDAVILDLVMPKGGGRAAFEQIRARAPDARVLLASGYSVDPEVEALIGQGALFLEKPFTPQALRAKLSELFQSETALKSP